jgi:signal transduction histidine kinase
VHCALGSDSFEADERAVEDVLTNLLGNALIATDGRAGAVRMEVRGEGEDLWFTVEDDGPGVPKELEPRLFQAFATGRGRDARHPGTGLGLATSARLVARHGGKLWHERRKDASGARFVASFPRRARIDV